LDSSSIQKQSLNSERRGRFVPRYVCRSTGRSTDPSTRSTGDRSCSTKSLTMLVGRPFSSVGRPGDRSKYPMHYPVHVCAHQSTGRSTDLFLCTPVDRRSAGSTADLISTLLLFMRRSRSFWLLISSNLFHTILLSPYNSLPR